MKRYIILIILILNNSVFGAEKEPSREELITELKELEKVEKRYFEKGEGVSVKEIQNKKELLILRIEMVNPLYQDDFPRNLLPRVIRELIDKRGYSIHEAEEATMKQKPEAVEIFKRISSDLAIEKAILAKTRLQQRHPKDEAFKKAIDQELAGMVEKEKKLKATKGKLRFELKDMMSKIIKNKKTKQLAEIIKKNYGVTQEEAEAMIFSHDERAYTALQNLILNEEK